MAVAHLLATVTIALYMGYGTSTPYESPDPEERLVKYLVNETTYDKYIRPGVIENGTKQVLTIAVVFMPHRILGLDDRLETMSLLLLTTQEWQDPRLVWDPKDFGNLSTVSIKVNQVWTPPAYFPNLQTLNQDDKEKAEHVRIILSQTDTPRAMVNLDTYALVQERCDFDMSYFPFDRQSCRICIACLQYYFDEVRYESISSSTAMLAPGGEWMLEGTRTLSTRTGDRGTNDACFVTTVQRRSLYYVVNLFLPTISICVLNTIGLFASIDSVQGELEIATLGQTTLLSLSVLLLTVSDQTPKGSMQISLLGTFFLAMISQTLLATATAVYLKKCNRRKSGTEDRKSHCIAVCCGNTCMVIHLGLISAITATALAVGYANKSVANVHD